MTAGGGAGDDQNAYSVDAISLQIEDIFPEMLALGKQLVSNIVRIDELELRYADSETKERKKPPATDEQLNRLYYNLAILRDRIYVLRHEIEEVAKKSSGTQQESSGNGQREASAKKRLLKEVMEEAELAAYYLLKDKSEKEVLDDVKSKLEQQRLEREEAINNVKQLDNTSSSGTRPGNRDAILGEATELESSLTNDGANTKKHRIIQRKIDEQRKKGAEARAAIPDITIKITEAVTNLNKAQQDLSAANAIDTNSVAIADRAAHFQSIESLENLVEKRTGTLSKLKDQKNELTKSISESSRTILILEVAIQELKFARLDILRDGLDHTLNNKSTKNQKTVADYFPMSIDLKDKKGPFKHMIKLYERREKLRSAEKDPASTVVDQELAQRVNRAFKYPIFGNLTINGYPGLFATGLAKLTMLSDYTRQRSSVTFTGNSSLPPDNMSPLNAQRFVLAVQLAAIQLDGGIYKKKGNKLELEEGIKAKAGLSLTSGLAHIQGAPESIQRANKIMSIVDAGEEFANNRLHPLSKRSTLWPIMGAVSVASFMAFKSHTFGTLPQLSTFIETSLAIASASVAVTVVRLREHSGVGGKVRDALKAIDRSTIKSAFNDLGPAIRQSLSEVGTALRAAPHNLTTNLTFKKVGVPALLGGLTGAATALIGGTAVNATKSTLTSFTTLVPALETVGGMIGGVILNKLSNSVLLTRHTPSEKQEKSGLFGKILTFIGLGEGFELGKIFAGPTIAAVVAAGIGAYGFGIPGALWGAAIGGGSAILSKTKTGWITLPSNIIAGAMGLISIVTGALQHNGATIDRVKDGVSNQASSWMNKNFWSHIPFANMGSNTSPSLRSAEALKAAGQASVHTSTITAQDLNISDLKQDKSAATNGASTPQPVGANKSTATNGVGSPQPVGTSNSLDLDVSDIAPSAGLPATSDPKVDPQDLDIKDIKSQPIPPKSTPSPQDLNIKDLTPQPATTPGGGSPYHLKKRTSFNDIKPKDPAARFIDITKANNGNYASNEVQTGDNKTEKAVQDKTNLNQSRQLS